MTDFMQRCCIECSFPRTDLLFSSGFQIEVEKLIACITAKISKRSKGKTFTKHIFYTSVQIHLWNLSRIKPQINVNTVWIDYFVL